MLPKVVRTQSPTYFLISEHCWNSTPGPKASDRVFNKRSSAAAPRPAAQHTPMATETSAAAAAQKAPSRVVHCCDALSWLEQSLVLAGASVITSLPDVSELAPLTLQQWKAWFQNAAKLVLTRCPDDGVAIFFQTDIKVDGTWVDKSYLVQRAAEDTGHELLWHKIVCRVAPGKTTFSRPAYHHMLCFSKSLKADLHKSTADVLPEAGDTTWARGMGLTACTAACKYVINHTSTRTIVDPFCGHGTVLAVANELGLNAIGVELSPKRAKQAEKLAVVGLKLQRGHSNAQHAVDSQQQQQQEGSDQLPQQLEQQAPQQHE